MQRLRDDRGATAAIVVLLMVPLLAVAAVAIDVAAMHVDKQQLQTGADAAALAVAQDCARGGCETAASTAQAMAEANVNDGEARGTIVALDAAAGTVTVRTDTVREHWFAPIIGIDETPIAAEATARWGYPTAGTSVLPLTFAVCEISAQTGIGFTTDPATGDIVGMDIDGPSDDVRIVLTKESKTSCTGQSNNYLPGGFGWLVPEERYISCEARTEVGKLASSDPGKNFPCNGKLDRGHFEQFLGRTLFLPIFDEYGGKGSGGTYSIIGYAAFTLTDYHFGNSYTNPARGGLCDGRNGNGHCVAGRFTAFTDSAGRFELDPNGPKFGAAVVELSLPDRSTT